MTSITNIDTYTSSMSKAVDDKLFFLDRLKTESGKFVLFDFGCADGTLLETIRAKYPEAILIGYDNSEAMIEIAKTRWSSSGKDVIFSSDWNWVAEAWYRFRRYRSTCETSIVLLSSVLHEIYSYGTQESIEEDWERIVSLNADFIAVRDMMWSDTENVRDSVNLQDVVQTANCVRSFGPNGLKSFEEKWGSIDKIKNLTHFLLKYPWQINWDRELNENYFPITLSELLEKLGSFKYEPQYLERISVPFIRKRIKDDFGVDFFLPTHIKGIFARI